LFGKTFCRCDDGDDGGVYLTFPLHLDLRLVYLKRTSIHSLLDT